MTGPILFCYDGSSGSQGALRAAADLITRPSDGYVLTVWQPVYLQLVMAGTFVAGIPDEAEIDKQESAAAKVAAAEGARLGKEHGYDLVPLTEQAEEGIERTIMSVAERVGATLIVCGQRGRGPLRAASLGSVSHALSSQAHVPVLSHLNRTRHRRAWGFRRPHKRNELGGAAHHQLLTASRTR